VLITLFIVSCSPHTIQSAPADAPYEVLLGKPLTDKAVKNFIISNHCSISSPYILCEEAGIDLLIDSNQIVDGVFLYLNKAKGFAPYEKDFTPYKGKLPLGLKFYDTMGAVEYKLKRQGIGNDGLPDSGTTPDHVHYMASYQEEGITIIYNSPLDEDAMIYAVLVRG
jgi:hypothetical protein